MNRHNLRLGTVAVVLASALLLLGTAAVRADTINFDTVASGTQINSTYSASHGVTFINPGSGVLSPADGNIYARSGIRPASSPNVVTVMPSSLTFFDRRWGGVQATFNTPQRTVSIDACTIMPPEYLGQVNSRPFLQAWDASNNFLGVVYFAGDQRLEQWETLTLTSSTANIKRIQFSCQYDQSGGTTPVYANFDNLRFETANVSNVSAQIAITFQPTQQTSILFRDQVISLRNIGAATISGPISVRVIDPTWSLANLTGMYNGQGYITFTTGNLAPNATVTGLLRFRRPRFFIGGPIVQYSLEVYSGSF